MTPNLGKSTFTDAELTQLRAEVAAFIAREGWTKRRFAEECGVPEGTFGPWLSDSYQGARARIDEIAARTRASSGSAPARTSGS